MSDLERQWGRTAFDKAAREVYVDSRGMAHDDEGNSWQVDRRRWPEGTYGGRDARALSMEYVEPAPRRQRPPKMDPAEQTELKKQAIKLGLALLYRYDGKGKSAGFVADVYGKRIERGYGLSEKQADWFESLVKGNSAFMTKIPTFNPDRDDVRFLGATHILVKKGGPLEKWADRHFETITPAGADKFLMLKGKGKASAKPTKARDDQLEALQDYLMQRPGNDFMLSILRQLQSNKGLSTAQLKAVRRNFYQARMRDKADLFR